MKTLTSVFILLATYQAYAAGPKPVVVFKDKAGAQITLEQAWQISAKVTSSTDANLSKQQLTSLVLQLLLKW